MEVTHRRGIVLALVAACGLTACAASAPPPATGKAGSMARFAVRGQHLYAVSDDRLHVFSLADPTAPQKVTEQRIRRGIETIFALGGRLYLGSRTGMYILDLADPARPNLLGEHRHVVSCDPVVVRGTTAFVTLRQASGCWRGTNELQILDVSKPASPRLLRTYRMAGPAGLGVDGRLLFVADRGALKIFDAGDPTALRLLQTLPGIRGYDVIPNDGVLIISAQGGIFQFDYRRLPLTLLSRLPTNAGSLPLATPPRKKITPPAGTPPARGASSLERAR